MRILAIESSAKAASAALVTDGNLSAQYYQHSGLTHSRTLLPMVESLLDHLELGIKDVDKLAVARGPGSFTGIRIGVATAKGLAWAQDKPLVGVSTLEAMAYGALHLGDGVICPVMDARRDQVYNALFQSTGGHLTRLCPDRAIAIDDLIRENVEKRAYFLVGDGAALCYNWLDKAGLNPILLPEHLRQQTAWGVAMAAMDRPGVSAHDLNPEYIRPSQAERERAERLRQNQIESLPG